MCAQFHPSEDLVVSASLDQTVRVWDISGELPRSRGYPVAKPTSKLQLPKAKWGRKSSLLSAGTSGRKLKIIYWWGSIPLNFHEGVGCWLEGTSGCHLVHPFAWSKCSVTIDEVSCRFVQPKNPLKMEILQPNLPVWFYSQYRQGVLLSEGTAQKDSAVNRSALQMCQRIFEISGLALSPCKTLGGSNKSFVLRQK